MVVGAVQGAKVWAPEEDEAALRELNAGYVRAFMNADAAWYDAHLTDDFTCILTKRRDHRSQHVSREREEGAGNGHRVRRARTEHPGAR